jgi:hypothetical protein
MMKIRILLLASLTAVIYVLLNQASSSFSPNTQTTRNFILLNDKEFNLLKMIENKETELIYIEFQIVATTWEDVNEHQEQLIMEQAKSRLDGYKNIVVNDSCSKLLMCLSVFLSSGNEEERLNNKENVINQIKSVLDIYRQNYFIESYERSFKKNEADAISRILFFSKNVNLKNGNRILNSLPILPSDLTDKLKEKYQDVDLNIFVIDERNNYMIVVNSKTDTDVAKELERDLNNYYNLWGEVKLVDVSQNTSATRISESILLLLSLALSFLLSFGLVYLYERYKDYSK